MPRPTRPFCLVSRRALHRALTAMLLGVVVASGALAQSYPSKPVRMVVPAPPGGGTDFLARWIGAKWSEQHRQPVVVDNVSGANGNIGSTQVARAPADGYTLMMSFVGTQAINPNLYKASYMPQNHLTAVVQVATYPFVVAVNANGPIRSLADIVTQAKAKPGALSFSSAGIGSGGHIVGEMFASQNGIKLNHIAYRGSAPAAADVAAGQVDMIFDTLAAVAPLIQAGKLRPLAVTSEKRIEAFRDIPTVGEQGMSNMVISGWYGIFAPKDVPAPVLARISEDVNALIATPAFHESVEKIGYVPSAPNSPKQFQSFVTGETARYGRFIEKAGISAAAN